MDVETSLRDLIEQSIPASALMVRTLNDGIRELTVQVAAIAQVLESKGIMTAEEHERAVLKTRSMQDQLLADEREKYAKAQGAPD